MTTDKQALDFGSDADYGKGSKAMRNELGVQLQKLANQGYLMLNIVHAEDKVDFTTQKTYIGTSLSNSLYGVAEKFVDQIIYLRKDENKSTGKIEHRIWFNEKGGFSGAGGRWTPTVDSIECSYDALEKVMKEAISKGATASGAQMSTTTAPSVTINQEEYDFVALKKEFQELTEKLVAENPNDNALRIKGCVEGVLGAGKKAGDISPAQAELLVDIITSIKDTFHINNKPTPSASVVVKKDE